MICSNLFARSIVCLREKFCWSLISWKQWEYGWFDCDVGFLMMALFRTLALQVMEKQRLP